MSDQFRIDFTAHLSDGRKEMYMIVTAETIEQAKSIVENSVPHPIVIHEVGSE